MCTTIIVGEHATVDGSFLVARSADSSSLKAQHFVIHPAVTGQSGVYSCKAHGGVNDFSYPLPENAMRYTTVPNWKTQLHGAVGFTKSASASRARNRSSRATKRSRSTPTTRPRASPKTTSRT